MDKVTNHHHCFLVKKAFVPDSLDVDSLFAKEPRQILQAVIGEFQHNLYREHLAPLLIIALMDYCDDVASHLGNGLEGGHQLPGGILDLKFHGYLHRFTCIVR
jgi:hypothetical protein